MTLTIFNGLTFLATLGCGLMAGLFFIFSNTVMAALGQLSPSQGIAAMQSINRVILNRGFFSIFFGTAIVSILLLISLFWSWPQPGSLALLVGCLLYLLGNMLVTMVCNVPMNNALDTVDPSSDTAVDLWARYLKRWTAWNHVRAVTALMGMGAFILALLEN